MYRNVYTECSEIITERKEIQFDVVYYIKIMGSDHKDWGVWETKESKQRTGTE